MMSAPCLVDGREWNQAYAQLEMERGFCSLGGAEKYSPELVQRTAMESPGAAGRVVARGAEMLWRVGVFAFSLLADNASGRSEELGRVRLRAQQLRCAGLGFPARRSVRAAVVHSQAASISGIPGVSRDVWNSMRRGECGAPHKHEETVPLHCCLCCPGAACRVRMPTGCVSVLLDSPEPRSVKQALPALPRQGSPAAIRQVLVPN